MLTRNTLWWVVLFGTPALVGMFAAIVLPLARDVGTQRAAEAETYATMQAVVGAVEFYRVEYGHLPSFANHDLIEELSGRNAKGLLFLQLRKRDLNSAGEVVDRWGTPLRIVPLSEGGMKVVSAGPDKLFGTNDDMSISTVQTR